MCDCERALDLLSARLDGGLEAGEAAELEEHLAACPSCRAAAAELETLEGLLPELLEEEVPQGFHQRLMEKIAAEQVVPFPTKAPRRVWKGLLATAAVAAVVIIGGGPLLRLSPGAGSAAPAAPAPASVQADTEGGVPEGPDVGMRAAMPEAALFDAQDHALTPVPTQVPRVMTAGTDVRLTAERAAQVLALEEYPGGASTLRYSDDGMTLECISVAQTDGVTVELNCLGLSVNGRYYLFTLSRADGAQTRFAVALDGSGVLSDQEEADFDAVIEGE